MLSVFFLNYSNYKIPFSESVSLDFYPLIITQLLYLYFQPARWRSCFPVQAWNGGCYGWPSVWFHICLGALPSIATPYEAEEPVITYGKDTFLHQVNQVLQYLPKKEDKSITKQGIPCKTSMMIPTFKILTSHTHSKCVSDTSHPPPSPFHIKEVIGCREPGHW